MVIYEVNLTVKKQIESDFAAWLQPHIDDILKLEGFESAEWFDREPDGEDAEAAALWTIQYRLKDRESLTSYFEHHAAAFRQDGLSRFPDQFSATRRILLGR